MERVLFEVENNIKSQLTVASLSKAVYISPSHLQRLFKFAFEQPIASYIRSRRLAASLEALLKTDLRIIDIAEEYGFEYEQTFIRAFKREFGHTPGNVRNAGLIVKIMPPLQLSTKNRTKNGLLFGPDIVMVPAFNLIGKQHRIPIEKRLDLAPKAGRSFWENEQADIAGKIDVDDVYIGLTTPCDDSHTYYLSSVRVCKATVTPPGLFASTFPASLCAKFRYIGQHHFGS